MTLLYLSRSCSAGAAALLMALAGCAGLDPNARLSAGTYRIPYADGTRIRVARDTRTHTPPGRLDVVGVGALRYRIVAAAPGVVRYAVDEFSVRQDSRTAAQCNNNYVWIEHASGEWTKYSHMRTGSTRAAGVKAEDTIQAGTYLGDEGDVGCATGSHLHFEVAIPRNRVNPIQPVGGFVIGDNRVPRFCHVAGEVLVAGTTHTARACDGSP